MCLAELELMKHAAGVLGSQKCQEQGNNTNVGNIWEHLEKRWSEYLLCILILMVNLVERSAI